MEGRDLERASCLFVRGREEMDLIELTGGFAAIFRVGFAASFAGGLVVVFFGEGFAADFAGLEGFGRSGVESGTSSEVCVGIEEDGGGSFDVSFAVGFAVTFAVTLGVDLGVAEGG